MSIKTVLVTGANGFIGKNMVARLREESHFEVLCSGSGTSEVDLASLVAKSHFVVHLAGVNRPQHETEFTQGNVGSADSLAEALTQTGRAIPVIYTSSEKASEDTPYGISKRGGEARLLSMSEATGSPLAIFRLPNVFGKWCRPNYNSAVATFCANTVNRHLNTINDRDTPLNLVYIDDVVTCFLGLIEGANFKTGFFAVPTVYSSTVGMVADTITGFRDNRAGGIIGDVGTGLTRALYATYVSHLPLADFSYPLVSHCDERGVFSEMLKTRNSGQFSYFTAKPKVTRGGHYHHTKTEKFLIVSGKARFRFRHILTNEEHEIITSDETPVVVETIPGWTHDVTNIGDETLVSMLWANEIFDVDKPDTIAKPL